MVIRRVIAFAAAFRRRGTRRTALALAIALAVVWVPATPALAEQAKPNPQADKKRNKQEQAEIEQLVKLIDGVMSGQPAPTS